MTEYQYLVKKVVFETGILPLVKVCAAFYVHLFFAGFTLLLYGCYGYFPDLQSMQVIYYSFCTAVFVTGLCYFTSAVMVFFRDLTQIIQIILQVGIWMTPIMWDISTMGLPRMVQIFFKLNPMYYIVQGYRDALIDKGWFWENMRMTAYFWGITVCLLYAGTSIFRRLKIHFADVL